MPRSTKVTIIGATGQLRRIEHPCGCVGDYAAPLAHSQCVNLRRCPLSEEVIGLLGTLDKQCPKNRSLFAIEKVAELLTHHTQQLWLYAGQILHED